MPRWAAGIAPLLALALAVLALTAPTANAQPPPVGLGTADSFAVLAGSTVTNTGPTVVSGDLGVSPGNAVVGFPPGTVINGTIHAGDAVAAQAQSDLTAGYNDAAGRACDVTLTGQDLGGLTLTEGVYCFSSSAQLTGTLTLDAQGDLGAVFIFQIGSTLTTASGSSVNLINGAQPCNVFWQIGISATLGTTTSFVGTVMALTSITANTDATVEGRLLARNGAVTLDSNEITRPTCAPPPPPSASITIVKDAEPDGPQDFEFTGDLGNFVLDDDPGSPLPRERTFDVDPGTYTVTESDLPPGAGYDLENINCTGGDTTVDLAQRQVVIDAADGDEVTCVFVNEADVPPPPPPDEASITIVKDAEPDGPQDFEFTGDLGNFILDDDPLSATPRRRSFTVQPGTYTVRESVVQGFDLESITCTGGQTTVTLDQRQVRIDVADGDAVSCVFVNEADVPPPPPGQASITIVKDAEPDSPQNFEFTGDLGNFILDDDPLSATPRQRRTDVDPGTYTVRESVVQGWDLESINCTGGQVDVDLARRRVVITVEPGETLTCVFVNEAAAIPPPPPGQASITIVKDAEPDSPQNFEFTGDLGNFILDDDPLSATPRERRTDVEPGTYTVRESVVQGWDLESINCTGGQVDVDLARRRVVITVEPGETLTCVFVNEAAAIPPPPPGQASITIVKDAEPDSPQNFEFTGDLGNFILDDDPLSATPRERRTDVDPGTYTITESELGPGDEPYDLESINCTGGQVDVDLELRQVVITVEPGETLTCVFVNIAAEPPPPPPPGKGAITIVKDAVPNSPQNFEFTGDLGNVILDDDPLSATPRQRRFDVDPGTYTVRESFLNGFDLESINCTGGQVDVDLGKRHVIITVEPGETLTCVFVNVADQTPPPPPPPGRVPIRERGGISTVGIAVTGAALGGLLTLGFVLLTAGGGLLYVGRHRAGRAGGRHRPRAVRALRRA